MTSHETSVASVNEVAGGVIASEGGALATDTRNKVDTMNKRWDVINAKLRDKQIHLEAALREVLVRQSSCLPAKNCIIICLLSINAEFIKRNF